MDTTAPGAGSAGDALGAELPGSPPRLARALYRLTAPRSARVLQRAHCWFYERSDGRIGHGTIGAPTLLLTTIGRRSGRRRCIALCYGRDGERLIIAASNNGGARPPAWFHNLQANATVGVQVGRRHLAARATVIDASDPDHRRLWGLLDESIYGKLDAYQAKTSRPIPLVVLTPTRLAPAASSRNRE